MTDVRSRSNGIEAIAVTRTERAIALRADLEDASRHKLRGLPRMIRDLRLSMREASEAGREESTSNTNEVVKRLYSLEPFTTKAGRRLRRARDSAKYGASMIAAAALLSVTTFGGVLWVDSSFNSGNQALNQAITFVANGLRTQNPVVIGDLSNLLKVDPNVVLANPPIYYDPTTQSLVGINNGLNYRAAAIEIINYDYQQNASLSTPDASPLPYTQQTAFFNLDSILQNAGLGRIGNDDGRDVNLKLLLVVPADLAEILVAFRRKIIRKSPAPAKYYGIG